MGLATAQYISNSLADFLHIAMGLEINRGDKISRIDATRHIANYIRDHSLYNPENRLEIQYKRDPHLAALFKEAPETLTYFNLGMEIGKHFIEGDQKAIYDTSDSEDEL